MHLRQAKHIHFLGIGGIGVSALAYWFKHEGRNVSGQDTSSSPVTDELKAHGIAVTIGQKIFSIPKDADAVIYSVAISEFKPEFIEEVRRKGIPVFSYPEALGLLSKDKHTIAIAGTHGKTTTTAMVAKIFIDAGLKPTVIVGSLFKGSKKNFIAGTSDYLIVEADDYRRAFLHLEPTILIITNIGLDHLDYYQDLADIESAFAELAAKAPKNGYVITSTKVRSSLGALSAKTIDYTDFLDTNLALKLPGKHNRENAAAAAAAAHVAGIVPRSAQRSLKNFSGTWRRFDFKGKTKNGALVYDDYAHNPEKVRAAIAGFREKHPRARLVVVFQPHLYSRTKTLLKEFSESFAGADEIVITPIFAAREKRDPSISGKKLAAAIKQHLPKGSVRYAPNLKNLETSLRSSLQNNDVLVTMGAGDIYHLAEKLVVRKK